MYSHNAQMKCGANYATLPRIMARPGQHRKSVKGQMYYFGTDTETAPASYAFVLETGLVFKRGYRRFCRVQNDIVPPLESTTSKPLIHGHPISKPRGHGHPGNGRRQGQCRLDAQPPDERQG